MNKLSIKQALKTGGLSLLLYNFTGAAEEGAAVWLCSDSTKTYRAFGQSAKLKSAADGVRKILQPRVNYEIRPTCELIPADDEYITARRYVDDESRGPEPLLTVKVINFSDFTKSTVYDFESAMREPVRPPAFWYCSTDNFSSFDFFASWRREEEGLPAGMYDLVKRCIWKTMDLRGAYRCLYLYDVICHLVPRNSSGDPMLSISINGRGVTDAAPLVPEHIFYNMLRKVF